MYYLWYKQFPCKLPRHKAVFIRFFLMFSGNDETVPHHLDVQLIRLIVRDIQLEKQTLLIYFSLKKTISNQCYSAINCLLSLHDDIESLPTLASS